MKHSSTKYEPVANPEGVKIEFTNVSGQSIPQTDKQTKNFDDAVDADKPPLTQTKQANIQKKKIVKKTRSFSPFKCGCNLGRLGEFFSCIGVSLLVLFVISILGILIALMIFYFGNKDVIFSSVSGGLDYINFNLNRPPITDIKLVPSTSFCPQEYERLKIDRWPGTADGCLCPNNVLTRGICPKDNTTTTCTTESDHIETCPTVIDKKNCTNITGINPIDISIWDDQYLCVTRIGLGDNYVKSNPCPQNFKECWAGNCIKESLACPVTSILLTNVAINSSSVSYGPSKFYTLLRELGKTPIIDITHTINNIPCFSTNEMPSGGPSYILINDSPGGCQKYGLDNQFSSELQHEKLEQVLRSNKFPEEVFELPNYLSILQATDSFLTARNKIPTSRRKECLSMDFDVIDRASDETAYMDSVIKGTSITGMLLHVAAIALLIFFACNGNEGCSFGLPYGIFVAEIILYIIMANLVNKSYSNLDGMQDYFTYIKSLGCFQTGQPQQVIQDYTTLVNDAYSLKQYSLALAITSASTVIPGLISLVLGS